jgi:hypothetical protein
MERYGNLFRGQGTPVRLGLYFPLLDEWREWGIRFITHSPGVSPLPE